MPHDNDAPDESDINAMIEAVRENLMGLPQHEREQRMVELRETYSAEAYAMLQMIVELLESGTLKEPGDDA